MATFLHTTTVLMCVLTAANTAIAFTLRQGLGQNIARRLDKLSCMAPVDGVQLSFHKGGEPSDYSGKEGDRVELVCEVFGAPQATIHWTFNGRPIDETTVVGGDKEHFLNTDMRLIGSSTTKSVLVIDCLDRSKVGKYGCHADNKCTKPVAAFAAVTITPQESTDIPVCTPKSEKYPPAITMWTDLRLERPEASVQLFCRAIANPPAEITWWLVADDESQPDLPIPNDETHMVLKNGDLIVRGKTAEDSDGDNEGGVVYKCMATNARGSSSTNVVLVRSGL